MLSTVLICCAVRCVRLNKRVLHLSIVIASYEKKHVRLYGKCDVSMKLCGKV